MGEWHNKLLVADVDLEWRSALLEQLEAHHLPREAVAVTEHGVDVQRALLDREGPPTVLVVAHHLRGMSGLEAIYQAYRQRGEQATSTPTRPTLCLIAEVRSDVELLELLRRRGIRFFVQREDPLSDIAQLLLSAHFGDLRRAPRYPAKIPVQITIETRKVSGIIENLSDNGCLVAIRDKKAALMCSVGNAVGLEFEAHDLRVVCQAEIRQLAARKKLLGDVTLIGVRFDAAGFDARKAVETIVRRLQSERATSPYLLTPRSGGPSRPEDSLQSRLPLGR